ncbi:MAG: cytochrome c biogenesis protein CcdA [Candidatus Omnitrophota bacterium]
MIENLTGNLEFYLNSASLLAYLVVFVAGVFTSFTPCIYPILPITVSYIGAESAGSRMRGFLLSVFYVLGTAVTYSVLGAVAALSGKLFGRGQANPITYFIVANVCILLGLSMLEVYELPLPAFLKEPGAARKMPGPLGAFFIGAASGLVLGPCTAPVLAVILTFVAAKQNVIFGISLLFTFALGLGMILLIAGTFAGFLFSLPKAGRWMVKIKKIFGFIMISTGEYFLFIAGRLSV